MVSVQRICIEFCRLSTNNYFFIIKFQGRSGACNGKLKACVSMHDVPFCPN